MDLELRVIGTVRSSITDRGMAPKNEDENAPAAVIEIDPAYIEALDGLEPGMDIDLATWFHLSDRSRLKVHPRGDKTRPERGVFATRSPDRPNPIGLHRARITAIDGTRLSLEALEALDGTPVIDIKPDRDRARRA